MNNIGIKIYTAASKQSSKSNHILFLSFSNNISLQINNRRIILMRIIITHSHYNILIPYFTNVVFNILLSNFHVNVTKFNITEATI